MTREALEDLLKCMSEDPNQRASISTKIPIENAVVTVEGFVPGKTPAGTLVYTKYLKDPDWITSHVSTL